MDPLQVHRDAMYNFIISRITAEIFEHDNRTGQNITQEYESYEDFK